jgi:CRISPR-associated protein (TIGR02710 family)
VGTGVGDKKGAESLASGILFSIKNSNPDKVYFVVTPESSQGTLPLITAQDRRPYEEIQLKDPDDINSIYNLLKDVIPRIKKEFQIITVDYTSGTKAMTAALAIVGTLLNVESLSYVAGEREGGIVIHGTEQVRSVRPFFDYCERRTRAAIEIFNLHRYEAVLQIIRELKEDYPRPELLDRLQPLETAARAYDYWDRFSHQLSFQQLDRLKIPEFDGNKEFLARIHRCLRRNQEADRDYPEDKDKFLGILNPHLEPEFLIKAMELYLVDIIANAARRAEIEGRYDDAVARLYRAVELISQYRLYKRGVVDTSQVDIWTLSPRLAGQWSVRPNEKIRLALDRGYTLLAELGDDLAKKYIQDNLMRDSLQKRNSSILAHGLKAVSREEYEQMAQQVNSYAEETLPAFRQWLRKAAFIKWPSDSL